MASREKGAALMTAMAAVLILSISASVVLGLTWRRMQMSANRKDHLVAVTASDAGLQYVFARLAADPAWEAVIRADATPAGAPMRVISPQRVGDNVTVLIMGVPTSVAVDEQVAGLALGNKQVHIAIEIDPNDAARLRIHSNANYG